MIFVDQRRKDWATAEVKVAAKVKVLVKSQENGGKLEKHWSYSLLGCITMYWGQEVSSACLGLVVGLAT